MSITNITKTATSLVNQIRVSIGEMWSTITTTWASETRTWEQVSQLIDNESRPSVSITNVARPE